MVALMAMEGSAAAQKIGQVSPNEQSYRFCVRSTSLGCPPAKAPVRDVANLDGPCWGWFGSKRQAERFVRALPRECGYRSQLIAIPKQGTYTFEGHQYAIEDQIILVDSSHTFARSRPIKRDALVVLAQRCFDGASYVGPGLVLDAPTGKVYAFDSVWGAARKDAQSLYLTQSFRVETTNVFEEVFSEYLTGLKSRLGKQFKVQPEEIQLFAYGDLNEGADPVVMAYLTVLDLRTGKLREIPRLGVAEIWSVGEAVFGSVVPSHCTDWRMGDWKVLANDPLRWIPLTPKQNARATEGLKEQRERTSFGSADTPGVTIGATRDRSMVLFITAVDAAYQWTVLQVGRRTLEQGQKK